jgi:heavy metal translocating P-type ATPase
MSRRACAHCGLPVSAAEDAAHTGRTAGPLFCCYGCAVVSGIVGRRGEDSVRAWAILRLAVGTLLAMNVMMISLLLYTGQAEADAVPVFHWILLGLATPAILLLGYPMVAGAVRDLRRGRLSLDALIALGSLAAYGAGAAATVRGRGQVYFDTATMLLVLVTFGKLIEATAKARAGRLARGLETLLPERAMRLDADGPHETRVSELCVGDRLQVRPGERFAADGRILEGTTTIEEAAFTGESRPRTCGPGDDIFAGTVNGPAAVVIEARAVGEALLVRRIAAMVDEARQHPSESERLADRAAALFVPAVLALAVAAGAVWLIVGGPQQAGFAALAVLVVACPCAMGIAAPLATALAIARAARAGVLVRGGDVMERVGRIGTIFFDKTGTLTEGRPAVREVHVLDPGTDADAILSRLAALEGTSGHALGRAVRQEAARRHLAVGIASGVEIVPGRGLRGTVTLGGESEEVSAGTSEFVERQATGCRLQATGMAETVPPLCRTCSLRPAACGLPSDDGATVIDVSWQGRPQGRVLLADEIRPDAAEAVRQLRAAGVEPIILSGDRPEAARQVAAAVGIDRVEAPRRPDEKLAVIQAAACGLRPAVCFVGDGINDAPALAAADVGIALGAGTDLARQAGHVVLLSDRLAQVPWLVALSRQTRRIIRQNLWWAFGYNAVALAAAAAGVLHPLLAAVAMVVSSLTVLGNSLRLQRFADEFRPPEPKS